jgi:pyruvate formate lyase activating enzyme
VEIRLPVIPGVNDGENDLRQLGALIASLPGAPGVELLPYHRAATGKYERLNRDYPLPDVQPPSAERMQALQQALQAYGLVVKIGG